MAGCPAESAGHIFCFAVEMMLLDGATSLVAIALIDKFLKKPSCL
jgi:hypothetical protein